MMHNRILVDWGPFGHDAQIRFTKISPGIAFALQVETFGEAIQRRIVAWHDGEPWTEGLARLFDAAQEEVLFQCGELASEGRHGESTLVNLSTLQRWAHRHLIADSRKGIASTRKSSEKWNLLLVELDQAGVALEEELHGKPTETVMALRQKGRTISTWVECYVCTTAVKLEDGTLRRPRGEITHHLHNVDRQAEAQLGKVWSTPKAQRTSAGRHNRPTFPGHTKSPERYLCVGTCEGMLVSS